MKPEVRKDYIHDRFVIIAPKRSQRPHDVIVQQTIPISSRECPFCSENFQKEKALLTLKNKEGKWRVKVIPNAFPVVTLTNPKAYGQQEVIVETPEHNVELADLPLDHVIDILKVFQKRTEILMKNKKIKYILIFKNQGGKAGASLTHAHSQIFAAGFLPPHIVDKLTKAQEYRIKNGICYYCHLLTKEARGPRQIFSDKNFFVLSPYAAIYNYEAWFLPRRHLDNITQLKKDEIRSLAIFLKKILKKLNKKQLPYNFYLHQAVTDEDEHFYLRVCPRRDIWAGIELGSRLIINTVSPEEAAKFYRS